MSDTVLVALIMVAPVLLTQFFKWRKDTKEYRRSLEADNTANTKLDHITVLTNSTLSAANKTISDQAAHIDELLELIRLLKIEHEEKHGTQGPPIHD